MEQPASKALTITGELLTLDDGSVIVGGKDICGEIFEWSKGRADNVRLTIEEVDDEHQ